MTYQRNSVFISAAMALILLAGCGYVADKGAIPTPDTRREAVTLNELYGDIEPVAVDAPQVEVSSSQREFTNELRALIASDRAGKALSRLQVANLAGSAEFRTMRGICFALTGQDDRARQDLAGFHGDNTLAHFAIGLVAHRSGRLSQASRAFYQASRCTLADAVDRRYRELSLMYLAMVLGSEGRLRAASDAWSLFDDTQRGRPFTDELVSPDGEHYITWGRALYDLGDYAAASKVLDRAFRFNKSDPETPPMLVESLMRSDQLDAASEVACEMLSGPTDKGVCTELLVRLLKRCGDSQAIQARLADLVEDSSQEVSVVLALARSAWLLDQHDFAIQLLSDSIELVEYPHVIAETLFRWLLLKDRDSQALELVVQLLVVNMDYYDQALHLLDLTPRENAFSDGVISELLKAGSDDPDSPESAARLLVAGIASLRSGNHNAARSYTSRAAETNGMYPPAVSDLAEMGGRFGKTDIFANYAKRFEDSGQHWFALYLRGRRDLLIGDNARAIAALERSLQMRPAHGRARIMLAEAQYSQGNLRKALATLSPCIERYGQLRYGLRMADFYKNASEQLRRQDEKQADEALRRSDAVINNVLAFDAGSPAALTVLMLRYHESGDYIKANETAEKLYAMGCRDADFMFSKALVQSRLDCVSLVLPEGRFARAMKDLDIAISTGGISPRILAIQSDLCSKSGRHAQAAAKHMELKKRAPDIESFALKAISEYMKAGNKSAALELLKHIYATTPSRELKYLYYSLMAEDQTVEIKAILDELFPADDKASAFWRALCVLNVGIGRQLRDLGRETDFGPMTAFFDSAISQVDRDASASAIVAALDLSEATQFARRWFYSRDCSYWLTRYREHDAIANPAERAEWAGFDIVSRVAHSGPVVCSPVGLAVWRLAHAGQYKMAQNFCESIAADIRRQGRDGSELADTMLAELCSSMVFVKRRDIAGKLLRVYLDESPDSLVLLREALNVMVGQRRYDLYRERALRLAPLDPHFNNNLAYEWVTEGVNLNRSAEMLYRAMEYDGGTPIKDSLGWLMYKRGWLPRARVQLEQAVNESDGDNAVICDHLGDVYWRLGLNDQAVFMWREAIDLGRSDMKLRPHLLDDDSLKVVDRVQAKLDAVEAGLEPKVASLADMDER